jgi:CRISPR-associated protein Cas5h
METIVFDIWGDYGHFRVPYTTSSPITFPFPPKSSIYGIIGAILGYEKESYLREFNKEKWLFSVSLKKPVVKIHIPENFISTKKAKMFARMSARESCRSQINMEFLKEPFFRIYVTTSDKEAMKKLYTMLEAHQTEYTVSLGISECIANFKLIGQFEALKKISNVYINIDPVLPLKSNIENNSINLVQEDKKFIKVHMPAELSEDRELLKSMDFIVETNAKTVSIKNMEYYEIPELRENIVLY